MSGKPKHRNGGPKQATRTGKEYLVTFPAGLSKLVETCLGDDLASLRTRYSDDSALIVSSSSPRDAVTSLPYLKNTFEVLLEVPRTSVDAAACTIAKRLRGTKLQGLRGIHTFRLMVQIDGQLAPLDRRAKEALEQALKAQTGAIVNARGGSGDEFWLIGRRELPRFVLARRLSKGKKMPAAGSLGTELSHLLVRMSKPSPKDTFLDPFCGSGALVRARAFWPARRTLCADLHVQPDFTGVDIEYLREDALELRSVRSASVDVIVTDPPWGEHGELDLEVDQFYDAMVASFSRVLDPDKGRMVLLVARRLEEAVTGALRRGGFRDVRHVSLLVNGHPATALTAQSPNKHDARG